SSFVMIEAFDFFAIQGVYMLRREFLKFLGIGVGTAGATRFAGAQATSHTSHTVAAVPQSAPAQQVDWEAMNAHHKEGVDTFLANIGKDPMFWGNELQPTIEDGVKVFDIRCQEVSWDTGGGVSFPALTYNGTVPGPTI